jgi:hypothetical protein
MSISIQAHNHIDRDWKDVFQIADYNNLDIPYASKIIYWRYSKGHAIVETTNESIWTDTRLKKCLPPYWHNVILIYVPQLGFG